MKKDNQTNREQQSSNADTRGKFTGGEWKYRNVLDERFEISTDTPKGQNTNGYIATIETVLYTVPGQAEANALLISNAPKLFYQVKELKGENERLKLDIKVLNGVIDKMTNDIYELFEPIELATEIFMNGNYPTSANDERFKKVYNASLKVNELKNK